MLFRLEVGTPGHILAWLSQQNPDEEYRWENARQCPCGQYSAANGSDFRWLINDYMSDLNDMAEGYPRTYGTLYKRACERWGNG